MTDDANSRPSAPVLPREDADGRVYEELLEILRREERSPRGLFAPDLRDGGGTCEDPGHRDDENAWFVLHELQPLDALGPGGPRRCAACAWRHLHELRERTSSA